MAYWLMKSEPEEFSIDDLELQPGQREPWDGVRNYQARNMLRDEMKAGDLAFFTNKKKHITHVGIILDRDLIIHASGFVKIEKLTDHEMGVGSALPV